MDITDAAPPRSELVRRTAELVPLLRKHADWAEQNRRLHQETVEAIADAGLFRLRTPARYGGYESDARTLVDVSAKLAEGDGSTAWVTAVSWIPAWMAGLFPDEVQDSVFATPDVRVCGTLSPSGTAVSVDGGYRLNGRWGFISGAWHSHWQEIIAISPTPDGGGQPVMGLVPMSELQVVDDWHTGGLRGTGSVTTIAEDVFVPRERMLPLIDILQGRYASERNAETAMFRAPLLGIANASTAGPAIGLARAARAIFLERLPDRKLTYTSYDSQREAPVTHLQIAQATLKIDEAQFHADRVTALVDDKGINGEPWTMEERARSRVDVGAVCQLSKDAIDILATASGGSSVYTTLPLQRITHDIQAMNLHALMYPTTNIELYGRVLCGLEPNTLYI